MKAIFHPEHGEAESIDNVSWSDLEGFLKKIESGVAGYLQVLSTSGEERASLFGEPAKYALAVWEDEESVVHLVGTEASGTAAVDIAWSSFPARLVVSENQRVARVLKHLLETNTLLEEEIFEREDLA